MVALNGSDFADFIAKNKYVMVKFYTPWCGHCQSLAPEYAAAATELKAEGAQVVLAKVDATAESKLADEYKVEGFPTIYFFTNGEKRTYNGHRNKNLVSYSAEFQFGEKILTAEIVALLYFGALKPMEIYVDDEAKLTLYGLIQIGLHVVVTMFSGYLLGYATFRPLFSHNRVMNATRGILGLVLAMLVETLLFIIRTSEYDRKSSSLAASHTASHQKKNQ